MYTVTTREYEGPLQKLLELIQRRELEINRVSLAEVTAGFLEYIGKLEHQRPDPEHAEFLNIASKLILLKSLSLLPQFRLTDEEAEDLHALEEQLKVLAYVHECAKDIVQHWSDEPLMASREFMMNTPRLFILPAITAAELSKRAAAFAPAPTVPHTAYPKRQYAPLETVMERILSQLKEAPARTFTLDARAAREERVAFFLAVLHLMRKLKIAVSQHGIFGEITVYSK